MLNPTELKRSFTTVPGKVMTPTQEQLIAKIGNELWQVLSSVENHIHPDYYQYLQQSFFNAQSTVAFAISQGWKQTNY